MNATKKNWELKDRVYVLSNGKSPLTHKVSTRGIIWFDEEKGINREIRYAINQNSLFVDEQDKNVRLGHVFFNDGVLQVPKNKPMLQQLLSIYHPKAGKAWVEIDHEARASDFVEEIELELEALSTARELDIEHLEAIMRTELGSSVSKMSSKELKRDAYKFAKHNPKLFMDLVNDEDIKLRNLANRAVEMGILKLTDDNTVFKFATNGKKIMTVPFDQHPYAALASYFKTDEGVDLMKSIIKKLS